MKTLILLIAVLLASCSNPIEMPDVTVITDSVVTTDLTEVDFIGTTKSGLLNGNTVHYMNLVYKTKTSSPEYNDGLSTYVCDYNIGFSCNIENFDRVFFKETDRYEIYTETNGVRSKTSSINFGPTVIWKLK